MTTPDRVPCPFCVNGMYLSPNVEGVLSWAVCWHCLGCRTVPADTWSVRKANTERKAA